MGEKTGIKHRDLKPCICCGKGVMHDNNLSFYRVRIERFVANVREIDRAIHFERMMGSPVLANAMGPDADLAKLFDGPHEALVCEPCAMEHTGAPAFILETIIAKAEEGAG